MEKGHPFEGAGREGAELHGQGAELQEDGLTNQAENVYVYESESLQQQGGAEGGGELERMEDDEESERYHEVCT